MNIARIYMRASTSDQDATRARVALEQFADDRGLRVVGTYVENESGTVLKRPELFRMIQDSKSGDLVVVEGVDRLSRLSEENWKLLRQEIDGKRLRIVSMDLPTSWSFTNGDDFSGRVLSAINSMMMDVLAAVSRKDYEDRRRRQAQGIEKAKSQGRYKGRPEDLKRNRAIAQMLRAQVSWSQIQETLACSRATVSKVAKRLQSDLASKSVEA